MTTGWNPSVPCVYGQEWSPVRSEDLAVTGVGGQSVSFTVNRGLDYDFEWFASTIVGSISNISSVAYGDGVWLASALGTATNIFRSVDMGASWSEVSDTGFSLSDLGFGNGVWVAVGTGTVFRRSTDGGLTWTSLSVPFASWSSVATDGSDNWVAVASAAPSNTSRVLYSDDNGESWTVAAVPNLNWRSVAYGDGVFVAVASSGTNRVTRSTDGGQTWIAIEAAEQNDWRSVAYGDGVWVAVASSGTNRVMRSTDGGLTWEAVSAVSNRGWVSVAYSDGVWVAVAFDTNTDLRVMRSADGGKNWDLAPDVTPSWPSTSTMRAVAAHDSLWVVGGAETVSGSVAAIVRTPETVVVNDWYSYCPELVPGADDSIDVYRVRDLRPVTPVTSYRPVSGDASFGDSLRTGGAFVETYEGLPPIPSPINATVAIFSGLMADQDNRTFESLLSDSPATFVSGTYAGATIVPDPPGWKSEDTWSTSTPLVHREFVGLPSVPGGVTTAAASSSSSWGFHINNLGVGIDETRRVTGLTVTAFCQRLVNPGARNSEFDQPYRIRFAVRVDGQNYLGQGTLLPNTPQNVSFTWTKNPATGKSWTAAELEQFENGGNNGIILFMSRPTDRPVRDRTAGAVFSLGATVTHVEETRVGELVRGLDTQVFGWNDWTSFQLGSSDFLVMQDQTEYLFNWNRVEQDQVDRRPTLDPGGLGVRALGGEGLPEGKPQVVKPDFVAGVPRNRGEVTTLAPAFFGPYLEQYYNGQPYSVIGGARRTGVVTLSDGFPDSVTQLVSRESTLEQSGSVWPDRLRVTVRSQFDDLPDGDLNIFVVGFKDNAEVVMTESVVVSPSDLNSSREWLRFESQLNEIDEEKEWDAVGADGWYAIRFVATAPGVGWEILTLDTGDEEPGARPTSPPVSLTAPPISALEVFGGAASEVNALGFYEDATYRATSRVAAQIGFAPAPPQSVTVTEVVAGSEPFAPGCRPAVKVGWAAHDDDQNACDKFGEYEVQRRSGVGDWETIFVVRDETVTEVFDVEAPRNTESEYRVRHRAATGFASDWTAEQSVVLVDECCGYTFSSNHDANRTVWYDDLGRRDYNMLEEFTYYEFETGDSVTAQKPDVDRLDSFSTTILVAARGAKGGTVESSLIPAEQGRKLFEPLSVFAGSKRDPDTGRLVRVPYICVADSDGRRWFANVETPSASRLEPAGRHTLNIVVREVTRTPAPVVVEPPVAGSSAPGFELVGIGGIEGGPL